MNFSIYSFSHSQELKETNSQMQPKIAYLCLQATREGQASYAHVHEIIHGLRRRGWQIKLYEPQYSLSREPAGPINRILKFASTQLKMWSSNKFNIVYVRWHFAAFPTAFLAYICNIPVIQEINGPYEDLFIAWPFTRKLAWFFKLLLQPQLRWADAIITVTPELAKWVFLESGNSKSFVIPNGVNAELFRPDAQPMIPVPESFVVFFGALAPWQGIETMLDAIGNPEWPKGVKLVIIGNGAERSKVEFAASKGLVVYIEKVPYVYMPGIVAKSLAGLIIKGSMLGKLQTGLYPLKLFETLGCGVPVIVTEFPGQADLVRKGQCGLVIPPEDAKKLAQAVAYLHSHPEQKNEMGRRGRILMESEHTWEKRAEQTDHVIRCVSMSDKYRI